VQAIDPQKTDSGDLFLGPARVQKSGGWIVHEYPTVPSTNLVAGRLPAWHAVRADRQSAGRGRFQRRWVSGMGGLWFSAVLPVPPLKEIASVVPLWAGLATCEALRNSGVQQLRMRWPNDVLVQDRKLAGLLIDQFVPGLAVVGIGINVTNRPEDSEPALAGQVARLAELVPAAPSAPELLVRLLESLRTVWTQATTLSADAFLSRINALWALPRFVQLDLDGQLIAGQFEGVEAGGRLKLRLARDQVRSFEPHEVRLLRDA
jgi:BirA family biotin operon repressor/biotin-[acetyl-CoA-carboxylase] ligase